MTMGWPWYKRSQSEDEAMIPAAVTVKPQPVMTKTEAELYNLVRLTVQDRYLVLAQVPVWCLVDICSADAASRRHFLEKISLKRVDCVLVHPGTLSVIKVVEFTSALISSAQQKRHDLLKAVFDQAGIPHVFIPTQTVYTVPALARLLELEQEVPAEE
jgi:hypothetical protein